MLRFKKTKLLLVTSLFALSAFAMSSAQATTLTAGGSFNTTDFSQAGPGTVKVSVNGDLLSSFQIIASNATDGALIGFPLDFLNQLDSVVLFKTSALVTNVTALDGLTPLATFTNLTLATLLTSLDAGDNFFSFLAVSSNPSSYQLNVQITAVPLPAAAWLFLSAMVGLGALGRRRKLHAGVV